MNDYSWRPEKVGLRWVVKRLLWANWAGSAYTFHKIDGTTVKFWTLKGAQTHADTLNAQPGGSDNDR